MSQLGKQAPLERRVAWPNGEWSGTESQLRDVPDFWGRVDVGGELPAGECPECQALAYLEDNPQLKQAQQVQQPRQAHANTLHALHALYGTLTDLIEWDARMGGHEAQCWNKAREAM